MKTSLPLLCKQGYGKLQCVPIQIHASVRSLPYPPATVRNFCNKILFGGIIVLLPLVFSTAPCAADIPSPVIDAIIVVESGNNPWAVSKDGCRGVGQIKEETWYWVCDLMGVEWSFDDAFDREKNLIVMKYYLGWLKDYLKKNNRYSDDLLLAAYNAGPGAVKKYGWSIPPYRETQQYVKKVKAVLRTTHS